MLFVVFVCSFMLLCVVVRWWLLVDCYLLFVVWCVVLVVCCLMSCVARCLLSVALWFVGFLLVVGQWLACSVGCCVLCVVCCSLFVVVVCSLLVCVACCVLLVVCCLMLFDVRCLLRAAWCLYFDGRWLCVVCCSLASC